MPAPEEEGKGTVIVLLLVCDCLESWKVSESVYYLTEGPRLSHRSCLECEVGGAGEKARSSQCSIGGPKFGSLHLQQAAHKCM